MLVESIIKKFLIRLTNEFGKGHDITSLKRMRQFYLLIEKSAHFVHQLSWTHYTQLLPIKNINIINYYIDLCIKYRLGREVLKERIKSKEYERLPENTKNKLINNESLSMNDIIPEPILIPISAKQDSNGNQINTTYAPLNNPELTGVPIAPTATKGTNTNQIATTSFVASAVDGLASLNNPNFTGIPTAPKAIKGTNTTQLATTSFVAEAISDLEGSMHYRGTVVGGNLPTVGVMNGDTYKVAEAGTYDGRQAKVGDLFIAVTDGNVVAWTYVPSADDVAVTSITAGAGLTGGTITTTGTIALASSGVTAGTYQGLTIDTYGRVTDAQNMNYGNWVKPTLATNNNTYYLTGIQTTSSTNSTIYNTYISNTNSGVKYVSDTTNGGKMYVDNNEVTVGLYYAIN